MPAPPSRHRRVQYRVQGLPRKPQVFDQLVLLAGSLKQIGWMASADAKAPVDADGLPLPWLTYGAVEWLHARVRTEHRVFEYGAGNSTRWFARRAAEVHSVEHNRGWVERLAADLPANASVEFAASSGDDVRSGPGDRYHTAIERAPGPFDIVVIDGVARVDCVGPAIEHCAGDGIIVLDNSERARYQPAHEELSEGGFARIDFAGLIPGGALFSCTSVFGRNLDAWSRDIPPPTPMTHPISDLD